MKERITHIGVLTWATLVETIRRKDLYVVWILAIFSLGGGSVLASLGVRGAETFLRDIALTVVNFLSVAICIWLAARQMPEELARRTLFPLLARPVRRFDVLVGKFLAVWLLSCGALLVLAGIAWCALLLFRAGTGPIFFQYLFLRMLSFGPIAAMTMAMSLILTPPAAVTLSGLLTLFGTLFARTLADVVRTGPAAAQLPLKALYFMLPHLDLFDLSARTAYNYPPIPAWVLGVMFLYAAAYAAVFLGLGQIRFRRMAV
jgi:ABC-type transport system involved in multi-copper enzyme maturation permease subunit